MTRLSFAALVLAFTTLAASAQQEKKKAKIEQPTPTVATLAYGSHERQVLDFWQAKSERPTPLVLYIHGGGWRGGDKSSFGSVKQCLDAGISVAAINYRYVQLAGDLKPPVKAPLEDAARALQTIRSRAAEWNIDKTRIGATGGSAGGCSSLWLALHDDLARADSSDPIARESTRLYCAAVVGAQTTLDPKDLRVWMPNYSYGAHAFGLKNFQELHDQRDQFLPWIKEYSPLEHVSKDDPPIYMIYGTQPTPPIVGTEQKNATHSAVLGIKLEEKLKAAGVEVILVHQDRKNERYPTAVSFLIDRLQK